jgi:hypothetical protein
VTGADDCACAHCLHTTLSQLSMSPSNTHLAWCIHYYMCAVCINRFTHRRPDVWTRVEWEGHAFVSCPLHALTQWWHTAHTCTCYTNGHIRLPPLWPHVLLSWVPSRLNKLDVLWARAWPAIARLHACTHIACADCS